ncbi:hypothetical protein [Paracoccus sp. (in: a-proteobacteria)]|uniref:hypothetical protein n=1 Tax=Paracoccus sp. TaxID=267 RepID=UPI002AFDCFF1|nr:hypothetical protein [Paracoccus sp. (in: a-proteobacteria)]
MNAALSTRDAGKAYSTQVVVGRCRLLEPKSRGRGAGRFFERLRIGEINKIIRFRHGGPVLTDDGIIYLEASAHHFQDAAQAVRWAAKWCPSLSEETVMAALHGRLNGVGISADRLALNLRVSVAERQALDLRTIGAIGQTADDRRSIRRERDRLNKEAARQAARSEQPAKTKLKDARPWEALGISRATYFRRRKVASPASVSSETEPVGSYILLRNMIVDEKSLIARKSQQIEIEGGFENDSDGSKVSKVSRPSDARSGAGVAVSTADQHRTGGGTHRKQSRNHAPEYVGETMPRLTNSLGLGASALVRGCDEQRAEGCDS